MKTAMTLFAFIFSSLFSLSCINAGAAFPKAFEPGKPVGTTVPVTLNKTLMLHLINQVRRKGCQCGNTYYKPVPEILWSDVLEKAAFNHSSDMYEHEYFSHTGIDGSRAGERIEALGYNWKAYGENIGSGYATEAEVIEAWLKSPEHCKNMMSPRYKEVGVARVGNYWTQEFAAK